MKKLTAIFLTGLILITTLTACSGEIQDSSMPSSTTSSSALQTPSPSPTVVYDEPNLLELLSIEKSVTGTVVSITYWLTFPEFPENFTYTEIVLESDGKTMRFMVGSGLLCHFHVNTAYAPQVGDSLTIYYREAIDKNNVTSTIPTGIALTISESGNNYIKDNYAKIAEKYNKLDNPAVTTPRQAMLAVIDFLELTDLNEQYSPDSLLYYSNEDYFVYCNYLHERIHGYDELAFSVEVISADMQGLYSYFVLVDSGKLIEWNIENNMVNRKQS